MSVLEAFVLGIVQGLTEFLPVSSSGHLVLGQALLGIEVPGVRFEVVVHLGTLCAVVWVYRVRIGALLSGLAGGRPEAWRYGGLLLLASVPAGLLGVFGRHWFEQLFDRPPLAAGMLLATGLIVYSLRYAGPRASAPLPDASRSWWVGVAQALAILPGISRSGSTVAAGAWLGVDTVRMAEFSFLMSIPAILGAGLLELRGMSDGAGAGLVAAAGASDLSGAADAAVAAGTAATVAGLPLAIAFVAAAAAGIVAIRVFVRMLRANTFHRFAWYCWTVGAAYLAAAVFLPGLR